MVKFDHYGAARELIAQLHQAGYISEAVALNAAIEDGATGTEILMQLRFQLKKLINKATLTKSLRTLTSALLTELDEVLE